MSAGQAGTSKPLPGYFSITGVPPSSPGAPVPFRVSIQDFSTKPEYQKQWNLYQFALNQLQNKPEESDVPLSYYQVAGIHGLPYIQWQEFVASEDRPGDYCTHGTALFATWHRPYMLLFEQLIVNEALKIADGDKTYTAEALKIRLPYWDWASNSDIPTALLNTTSNITLSLHGKVIKHTIHNPLYSYKFGKQESPDIQGYRRDRDFTPLGIPNLIAWPETKRCPTEKGVNQPLIANSQLKTCNFKPNIYKLLTENSDYNDFSNGGYTMKPPPPNRVPLEHYHNQIHNYVGSDFHQEPTETPPYEGHMTEVPVSAFDPIFWLHHANVDRLYAIWQAMYPNSLFEGEPTDDTRLPATKGSDSAGTDLRPFYKEDETPWTSKMIQYTGGSTRPSTFDFNYSYPEIPSRTTTPAEVTARVYQLYGPTVIPTTSPELGTPQPHKSYLGKPLVSLPPGLPDGTRFRREWMAFVQVQKHLVGGNFVIFFFLGEAGTEPHQWISSPNLVGSFTTFMSRADFCGNCARQKAAGRMQSGGVYFTSKLYSILHSKGVDLRDTEKVEAYLKENLDWKIRKSDGTEYKIEESKDQVAGSKLTVGVASFEMAYPPLVNATTEIIDRTTGVTFDLVTHYKATEGKIKKGGLSRSLAVGSGKSS